MTIEAILDEAMKLPPTERSALLDELSARVAAQSLDVTEAWNREIRRRADDMDAGRTEPVPWEEVEATLLSDER